MKTTIICSGILLIAIIIMAVILSIFSCMSMPDREDFKYIECYNSALCMYYNQKNPDKSVCTAIWKSCCDQLKQSRDYQRLEYCKKNKFDNMTESECRMWLNQK